jgi:serine/threonine protein kinase
VKPGNILLVGLHAYLGDFGIARLDRHPTSSVAGARGPAAPEQLRAARDLGGDEPLELAQGGGARRPRGIRPGRTTRR